MLNVASPGMVGSAHPTAQVRPPASVLFQINALPTLNRHLRQVVPGQLLLARGVERGDLDRRVRLALLLRDVHARLAQPSRGPANLVAPAGGGGVDALGVLHRAELLSPF